MAMMEEEVLETSYEGNVFSRLFEYMKPHLKTIIFCLVLVLGITVLDLIRPMLIARAIDTYIEGYDREYAYVSAEDAQVTYDGRYLSKDFDESSVTEYALMVYYDDQYYFFDNLDRALVDELSGLAVGAFENFEKSENQLTIYGSVVFTGTLLDKDELSILRANDISGIKIIAILYAVVLIVSFACNLLQTWLLQLTGQNVIYTIRQEIFEHIHTLPLRFFDTNPVGRIVTRVTNDVESLNNMYTQVIVQLFKNGVLIIGYAVVMISINVKLALICFAFLPLIFVLTFIFKKLSRKIYRIVRTKVSGLNTFLAENISGMKLIQIFARENEKQKEFEANSNDLYKSQMKEIIVLSVFRPCIFVASNIALAVTIYSSGNYVLKNVLTIGTMYIFINYISSFFQPIQQLAEQFSTLQNALASAEKIFTVLDEKNTILEDEKPVVLDDIKGKIEFRHVWFAYEGEDYVLKDVSFMINPGEKVAFVGATGAGKSSILNLIGRYYDIQKGEILIDGVDIRRLSTKQIRHAIGQVQQDVFVFTGDIKSNIRLLNENITDEEIKTASEAVNAAHFIENLPQKYDEPVTERGSTLSAGQRQLLSFARTLAYDPTILVMDEATANIDTETEQLIQDALETLMTGRTTIMVAHRLSTIQHADNIIVLHKGRIRESGTHQQLLEQNGIYKKLYELQQQ